MIGKEKFVKYTYYGVLKKVLEKYIKGKKLTLGTLKQVAMKSAINQMDKYDHQRHGLSDWLAELELRFQLGEVDTDQSKINWCQLHIGTTGSYILAGLEDEASWETAKEALLSCLGHVSMKDEAWAALKNYKRGPKEIVELAVEVEKLARRLHPHDGEAAERQAMDTFLNVLERPLAAEVRKLGYHTMESVVSTARRIEKVLAKQADPKKELQMQEQIRLLQEGLEDVRNQIAQLPAATTATTATTASPAVQPPPPTRHTYQDFAESAPRRPRGQPPSPCFLCGEAGTSPPNARPSSTSSASPHQLGCWKGHLRPRWPKLGVGSVCPSPASCRWKASPSLGLWTLGRP